MKHEILFNKEKPAWPYTVKIGEKTYRARKWCGMRTDTYGNNKACNCDDLLQLDDFCVCIGRCWCPKHGGPRCVGGHD